MAVQSTKAGTLPAVAYFWKSVLDGCTVRTTTKGSRHSVNLITIILERRNGYAEECIMADAVHHPGHSDCPENPVSIHLKGIERCLSNGVLLKLLKL